MKKQIAKPSPKKAPAKPVAKKAVPVKKAPVKAIKGVSARATQKPPVVGSLSLNSPKGKEYTHHKGMGWDIVKFPTLDAARKWASANNVRFLEPGYIQ